MREIPIGELFLVVGVATLAACLTMYVIDTIIFVSDRKKRRP